MGKSVMLPMTWDLRPKAKDRGHKAKAFKYQGQGQGQGLDMSRSMAKKKTKANNDHKMMMTMMNKILVKQEIVILTDNPSSKRVLSSTTSYQ